MTLLPYSLLSPFLGVFVDRWDRRRLLIGTNLARAGLLATFPLWLWMLNGDLPLMLGVLGILGLGRLFQTTKGAVLPVVLQEHHLLTGNTVSSVGGAISALAGGAIGLGVAQILDLEIAVTATCAVYALAALPAARIGTDLTHVRSEYEHLRQALGRIARELVEGVREIVSRPPAWLALASIFLLRTIAMIVIVGVILLIKKEFAAAEFASGLSLAAVGVGAFLGAVVAPLLGRKLNRSQLILAGFVVSGAGIVALGGISTIAAVLILVGLGGLGAFITKVSVDAQVQEALPDVYRGRAFALYDILYNVASVVAGVVVVVFEAASLRPFLVATGISCLILAGVLMVLMRGAGMLAATPSD